MIGSKINTLIIIPCFNEENRLVIDVFLEFLKKYSFVEFLFVNDGSSDDTLSVLEEVSSKAERINFIDLGENVGKAEAIRLGMNSVFSSTKYKYVGYFDADLATSLDEIPKFYNELENNREVKVIYGSRIMKLGSTIERRFKRHLFGRLFASTVNVLFKIRVYDSQCGAKLFSFDLAEKMFSERFVTNWVFDMELLVRMKKEGCLDAVLEVPVLEWKDVAGSKIKFTDFLKIPKEIYKLVKKYR